MYHRKDAGGNYELLGWPHVVRIKAYSILLSAGVMMHRKYIIVSLCIYIYICLYVCMDGCMQMCIHVFICMYK
jgi:hypothetical protein